jgi:hypothetical protein
MRFFVLTGSAINPPELLINHLKCFFFILALNSPSFEFPWIPRISRINPISFCILSMRAKFQYIFAYYILNVAKLLYIYGPSADCTFPGFSLSNVFLRLACGFPFILVVGCMR